MKRKISIAKSFKKDIAKQVIHLATAEWATGNVLTIDGGLGLGVTQE